MTVPDEIHPYLFRLASGDRQLEGMAAGEWDEILSGAVDHGLLWHLGNAEGLSAGMREKVKERCLPVSARNLALGGELRICLRALREAGVACAPIRGIALMERVYGGIVARPMGDIDLLVRRSEIDALRVALSSLDYREMDRRPGFSEAFSYSLKFLVERAFTIVVEPHLSIAYPPALSRLDMDAVWARCVPTMVAGESALSLCPEDMLLHLGLHLAHRDDAPLVWLWELDRFIRGAAENLDWGRLVALARDIGVGRILGNVLAELEAVFDTPIPDRVSEGLRSGNGQPKRDLSRLIAEHPDVREREGLAQLLALNGLGQKSRYLTALLMPTSEFMMQQYDLHSRFQLPWAYLRRASRFTWEGTKGIARLAFSRRSY